MGLWLQMTGCFKAALNYGESKSKGGRRRGAGAINIASIRIPTLHNSYLLTCVCGPLRPRKDDALGDAILGGFKMVIWRGEGWSCLWVHDLLTL